MSGVALRWKNPKFEIRNSKSFYDGSRLLK